MEAVSTLASHVRRELDKVIVGQHDLKSQSLIVLLCQGHALVEGVPGIAKTLSVKTLARLLGLDFRRVQCTSDLMPADILGTTTVNLSTGAFQLHKGPAFTEMLLVDEINRTPPRTQAALLECMEERHITIDGARHDLSPQFAVFATQNPIEFEGTYPLPEAQLDRFLLKISVPYPDRDDEVQLVTHAHHGFDARALDTMYLEPVPVGLLDSARAELTRVTVQEALIAYVVEVVRRTRDWPSLTLGASPRAAVGLLRVAKAMAAVDGRDYLVPDDVKAAALPVLRHRVVVKPEADLEGLGVDQILQDVLAAIEVPR
ncbi:MAG: MoxR family ATPase [Vicinamibacterales bacterium]